LTISNQQTMSKAPQLDIVGLSDPIISSGSSALSPTRSPLRDRNGLCSPVSETSTSQHCNSASLVISEEHITLGEREPLLNGSTGVRQTKKPFYRPRPLWYVPFRSLSICRPLLWTHLSSQLLAIALHHNPFCKLTFWLKLYLATGLYLSQLYHR